MFGPDHPEGPTRGQDVKILKYGLRRYEDDFFKNPPYDEVFNKDTQDAVKILQRLENIDPVTGNVGQRTWDVVWKYLTEYRKAQYLVFRVPKPPPKRVVPALGPVWSGGASILFHSLTHETDGFPNPKHPESSYPAFDDGWVAGRPVIAPEDLTVTDQSSSAGGDAFYATGASKLKYWFGHLAWAPPTGRSFSKGQTMGVIAHLTKSEGSSHVHIGINAVPLIGHDFAHKNNYQTGAPSVGEQLAQWAKA